MVAYIIIKNRSVYRKNIEALCLKAGIKDFVILDPEFDDIKRPLPSIITLGDIDSKALTSQLIWNESVPDSSLPVNKKKAMLESFRIFAGKLRDIELQFQKVDMPEREELKAFINKYKGQVFELSLKDGRKIGIYPDQEKLQGKYPIEYHASTAVNISKIMEIFDPEQIIMKES